MVEAVTYRLSDHPTADDASRYRSDAEVTRHWHDEPMIRLRGYLTSAAIQGAHSRYGRRDGSLDHLAWLEGELKASVASGRP